MTSTASSRRALPAQRRFEVSVGVLSGAEVEGLRAVAEELRESAAPSREILYTHRLPDRASDAGMSEIMDQWINPHRRREVGSTWEAAVRMRPWVEGLLGEPAVLFQDVLMDKRERHGVFPWHQDFPFWPVDRPLGVIVWVVLDPVDEVRGGLRLGVDESFDLGPPIDLHTGDPQPGFEGAVVDRPRRWECPSLAPGDAVVFSPLCWHSSGRNERGGPRRVWASSWLASEVRWRHAAAPRHPYLRHFADGELVGARGWAPLREEGR